MYYNSRQNRKSHKYSRENCRVSSINHKKVARHVRFFLLKTLPHIFNAKKTNALPSLFIINATFYC